MAASVDAEVRFIEYMDVGGATEWSLDKVFTRAEMLDRLAKRYGTITPFEENSSAPAERFTLPDGTVFGIIASTTTPFCRSCDRSRLTADGLWYLCLYAQSGIDLRQMLRAGASAEKISPRAFPPPGTRAPTAAPNCAPPRAIAACSSASISFARIRTWKCIRAEASLRDTRLHSEITCSIRRSGINHITATKIYSVMAIQEFANERATATA